jgi:hypothetical protein
VIPIQQREGFARGGNRAVDPQYFELAGEVEARDTAERGALTEKNALKHRRILMSLPLSFSAANRSRP